MVRSFLIACLLVFSVKVGAQQAAPINQNDSKGKPNGQWLVRQPERMGEPAFAEWGSFDHGVKVGTWYRFDNEGEVTAIEHFRYGQLDGEAKYFENGRLICVGHYRGLNPLYVYDTIYVVDPVTEVEYKRVIPSERGTMKHGLWQYYDEETGRLSRELEYSLDEVIAKKEFTIAQVDSAWYKRREAAMPHNQKHIYKPPRNKQVHYTDFH